MVDDEGEKIGGKPLYECDHHNSILLYFSAQIHSITNTREVS